MQIPAQQAVSLGRIGIEPEICGEAFGRYRA